MLGGSNLESFGFFRGDHNSAMELIEPDLKFSPSGIVKPSRWGVILSEGPDAGTFLQGQLTHDVLLLPAGQARFAGYCSAKGRLMASFIVLKVSNEKFLMVCHNDLIQSIVKRLSMFVLRAKVKLSDVTDQYELRGLLGPTAYQVCPALTGQLPWHAVTNGETSFILLHDAKCAGASISRLLWLGPKEDPQSQSMINQSVPAASEEDWQLAEVLSGIGMVQAGISEAFVPQMLNYESVDGVSFKKGCYPGQEVVARSQFRGTLKRRAYIVSGPETLQVGQEVFTTEAADQACGTVVSVAKFSPPGDASTTTWFGIVSMQVSATVQHLHLGDPAGTLLQVHALPYPLLEDI